jgi:hypothetical protein
MTALRDPRAEIDFLTTQIMDKAFLYGEDIRDTIRGIVGKAFYKRVNPNTMSDQDIVYVGLQVCDWQAIEENWREDADCEDLGPASSQLRFNVDYMMDENEIDRLTAAATAEDAKAPCHSNGAATERCAAVVHDTLQQHGWVQ